MCVFWLPDYPSVLFSYAAVCLCEYITSVVWDHEMTNMRMKNQPSEGREAVESSMLFLS